ncbi:MAG: sel1 repeat family protein [Myxococcaceae bacterium]|nr:MAG: sel1 repeat family protein [Myxococcaceae bacterium]
MPSSRFLFAWLWVPAFAVLMACAHASFSEDAIAEEARPASVQEEWKPPVRISDGQVDPMAGFDPGGFQAACDEGVATACVLLGGVYEEGTSVREDKARAADLYRRACDAGEPLGCTSLRELQGSPP